MAWRSNLDGWNSTEEYGSGGAVRLEQWVRPPGLVVELSEEGALALGRGYWLEVESFTHRLVRARQRRGVLELRLFGRWTLLRFGDPEAAADESGAFSRFPIVGGLLARRPGGSITFAQTVRPALELRATVDGFFPRLNGRPGRPVWTGALYLQVERRLHTEISHRYFTRMIREAKP
ncbi:MAG: hypothetical protein LH654_13970 [Thermoleophilia bacterium]|nr:hypothetical protein [Thermoleophilia bacterium]